MTIRFVPRAEHNETHCGWQRIRTQHRVALHAFTLEQSEKFVAEGVSPNLAEEGGVRAESRRAGRHVGSLATVRGVVIASDDRLAFQRDTVHVHHQRYNITTDNRDFTHGCT